MKRRNSGAEESPAKRLKHDDLDAAVAQEHAQLTTLRRDLHMHPEINYLCEGTQRRILSALAKAGITEHRVIARTGVIVDIVGTGEEAGEEHGGVNAIALRADMDALPMTEENSCEHVSRVPGVAHMCGHDGHMTMLIGAAKLIHSRRDRIPRGRTVRLLFQPAEEEPGDVGIPGAELMVKEGCLEGIDEVYGLHNWPLPRVGEVRVRPGPVMAHVTIMNIKIVGRGGHGSQPQACIDPVLVAGHVLTALQTVVSRSVDSRDSAVVSICSIHGGTTYNVIPNSVDLVGTLRDFKPAVFDLLTRRIETIVTSTCAAFGATGTVAFVSASPAVINAEGPARVVETVAAKLFGPDKVSAEELPMMASEDFSFYLNERPGCFFFLGTGVEGAVSPMFHSTTYDFNDAAIPYGVKMFVRIVEDRLGAVMF